MGYRDLRIQVKDLHSESIDAYYGVNLQLTERLDVPICHNELVEISKRNSRPEVRKEIIHFKITTILRLKEFVLRHQLLEEELNKRKFSRSNIRHVSDMVEDEEIIVDTVEEYRVVTCWKSLQPGHGFTDCLADRRIICYGY